MRFPDVSHSRKARLNVLQPNALEHSDPFFLETRALNSLKCGVKISRTVNIHSSIITVITVSIVKLLGSCCIRWVKFTALFYKVWEPIIIILVIANLICNYFRGSELKTFLYNFIRSFDNPLQNCTAGILKQIIRIIFDVLLTAYLCLKWDNNNSSPCTNIICGNLRLVICIKY